MKVNTTPSYILRPLLILGIISLFLSACRFKPDFTITPTATRWEATSTFNPTRVNPTFTPLPSLIRAPSLTATPLPSLTITASLTARSSRTPEPSITPSPTLFSEELETRRAEDTQRMATQNAEATMEGTWEARAATEEAILPGCENPISHDYSPDGNWVVVRCMDKNNSMGVYNRKNPTQAWLLQPNTIFNNSLHGWATYTIYPNKWIADGQYLYLSVFPCCADGPCMNYLSGIALLRLELLTGKVTQTIPADKDEMFYSFSFSTDGTHLAYLRTWLEHPILNLENLVTGEEQHIPLGGQYFDAGDVIWSPDKRQIIFSARASEDCENTTHYLVRMDLDDYNQTVLLESTTVEYSPIEWTADNHVIVSVGYEEGYISLDLATGETTPFLTSTPTK